MACFCRVARFRHVSGCGPFGQKLLAMALPATSSLPWRLQLSVEAVKVPSDQEQTEACQSFQGFAQVDLSVSITAAVFADIGQSRHFDAVTRRTRWGPPL